MPCLRDNLLLKSFNNGVIHTINKHRPPPGYSLPDIGQFQGILCQLDAYNTLRFKQDHTCTGRVMSWLKP